MMKLLLLLLTILITPSAIASDDEDPQKLSLFMSLPRELISAILDRTKPGDAQCVCRKLERIRREGKFELDQINSQENVFYTLNKSTQPITFFNSYDGLTPEQIQALSKRYTRFLRLYLRINNNHRLALDLGCLKTLQQLKLVDLKLNNAEADVFFKTLTSLSQLKIFSYEVCALKQINGFGENGSKLPNLLECVSQHPSLTWLKLEGINIQDETQDKFAENLSKCLNLRGLSILQANIKPDISIAISQLFMLTHLHLAHANDAGDLMTAIAINTLPNLVRLEELNFFDTNWKAAFNRLCEALPRLTGLKSLHMGYTKLSQEQQAVLAAKLADLPKLEFFDLQYREYYNANFYNEMCKIIRTHPRLEQLALSSYKYEESTKEGYLNFLMSQKTKKGFNDFTWCGHEVPEAFAEQVALTIHGRFNITDVSLRLNQSPAIIKSLSVCHQLTRLHIWDCRFDNDSWRSLTQTIKRNASLKMLEITYCQLTAEHMASLTESILALKLLRRIDLNGNPIGDQGAAYLSQAFSHLPFLNNLGLSETTLSGGQGFDEFTQNLGRLQNLRELALTSNHLSPGAIKILFRQIENLYKIKSIYMAGTCAMKDAEHKDYRQKLECKLPQLHSFYF